jgi:magnesium-transporting ATPase (P-type)
MRLLYRLSHMKCRLLISLLLCVILNGCDQRPTQANIDNSNFMAGKTAGLIEGEKIGHRKGYDEAFQEARPGGPGDQTILVRNIMGFCGAGGLSLVWSIIFLISLYLSSSKRDPLATLTKVVAGLGGAALEFWTFVKFNPPDLLFWQLMVPPVQGAASVVILLGSAVFTFAWTWSFAKMAVFAKDSSLWLQVGLIIVLGFQASFIARILYETFVYLPMIYNYLAFDVLFGVLLGAMANSVFTASKLMRWISDAYRIPESITHNIDFMEHERMTERTPKWPTWDEH